MAETKPAMQTHLGNIQSRISESASAGQKAKIAVLISGGGTNLQAIIDAVADGSLAHVQIALVVSNKSQAYGIERAKAAGIETLVLAGTEYKNKRSFEIRLLEYLREYQIQLVVLAGFMSILSADFITECPAPIVNIHPSLIPAFSGAGFYGLRVHQAALAAGVKVSGATVHFVNEICDGGKIIEQGTVRVLDNDTPEILQQRILSQVEHVIYPRAIEKLAAQIVNQQVTEHSCDET